MLSLTRLALWALPLSRAVVADDASSPTTDAVPTSSIYSSAHEAFQDLLNALPEESLQAALSGLKDYKEGVFESHHRGVEQVHEKNPALATKLIVAAVQDLKRRQMPSNTTTMVTPPAQSSTPGSDQISAAPASQPPSSAAIAPLTTTTTTTTSDRAVIVNVPQTTTTVVHTTSVVSQVTASVAVTLTTTNTAGQTTTTTDSAGHPSVITSAAQFVPTSGQVGTQTDDSGRTFVTTYTPSAGKISSIRLITMTGPEGKPRTITSYTFIDPATQTAAPSSTGTGAPGLQTAGAAAVVGEKVVGLVVVGGVLAFMI
ncbi:hypothetical protein ACEQ8H_008967 [Pleosporales sp. CAS-2024a]